MSTEQQSTAELIDKPDEQPETLIVPDEWVKDFQTIRDALAAMGEWKLMTVERHGITKITANRVAAKKMRIRIEELRKELGRAIMLRKSNVDTFADKLKEAVTAVETALEVIEDAHKAKVKAERDQREAEAAKVLNERMESLAKYNHFPTDVVAIGKMTPPDFLSFLDDRSELNLSVDAFRVFMHLGDSSISAVFRIEKKTGVGTLIGVNGLDVDRPF